jgi:hypothetical protein
MSKFHLLTKCHSSKCDTMKFAKEKHEEGRGEIRTANTTINQTF